MTLREMLIAIGFEVDSGSQDSAEREIDAFAKRAKQLLAGVGVVLTAGSVQKLAEDFNAVNDQLRYATHEMGDQLAIQQKLMAAAEETRISYKGMTDIATKLIKQNGDIFNSVDKATEFATLFAKTMKGAGQSEGAMMGAQNYMSRVFANGTLETSTYTRMMRQYPEIINTIAAGLDVSKDKLREMIKNGEVTTEKIVEAFSNASEDIQMHFDELDYHFSDVVNHIRNQWGYFADQVGMHSNITNGAMRAMVDIFDGVFSIVKVLEPAISQLLRVGSTAFQFLATAINKVTTNIASLIEKLGASQYFLSALAGLIAMMSLDKLVVPVLTKIIGLMSAINTRFAITNAQILATMTAIILIALLIDDFVNFMMGNDSIIGVIFERLGLDADAARETIRNAFDEIVDIIMLAGQVIMSLVGAIGYFIKGFMTVIIGAIKEVVDFIGSDNVAGAITFIGDHVMTTVNSIIDTIKGILTFLNGTFKGDWETAWNGIKMIFDAVMAPMKKILEDFTGLLDALAGGLAGIGTKVGQFFNGKISGAVQQATAASQYINSRNSANMNVNYTNNFNGTTSDTAKEVGKAAKTSQKDLTRTLANGLAFGMGVG